MKTLQIFQFVFFLSSFLPYCLSAQIGKVGINTTTPAAMLHVKDSSVLFTGPPTLPFPAGGPPASGPGVRMMWYSDKAAFRAGLVTGQQWNKDSIGAYSFANGYNARASAQNAVAVGFNVKADCPYCFVLGINSIVTEQQSFSLGSNNQATGSASLSLGFGNQSSGGWSTAIGTYTQATGLYSTSLGHFTTASGWESTAMGSNTSASGERSLATGINTNASGFASVTMGDFTKAKGSVAVAMGTSTLAKSFASVVLGRFNDTTSMNSIFWIDTDPVFIIGNGTSANSLSNALTVLKNAKTGINTVNPQAFLHVVRNAPSNGPFNANAAAIFEGDQGSFIQLSNENDIQSGILSGNEVTSIRSALIFAADSSIALRTGGNTTRFSIEKNGNIGIGTAAPQKLLHIYKGTSGATAISSTVGVFENNGDASISILTPNANESGLFFGNPSNSAHGGIVYNSNVANGLAFRTNGNSTKAVITSTGDVGIGDNTPNARLHVAIGNTGVNPTAGTVLAVESNNDAYISILTPSTEEGALYFGNNANVTHGGIAYNSAVANGLDFRTNGIGARAVINSTGDMGIGDQTPNARLHISNGTGGSLYQSESDLIIEDNNNAYIQFSSPTTFASGLLSGNSLTDIRSAILFLGDSSMVFRAGGNTNRLAITKSGNIGIGTSIPSEKLHVVGDICYTGTIGACSDIRYKKDFVPLNNTLPKILSLGTFSYFWDLEKYDTLGFTEEKQIGVIAQEVQKVFPEIIMTNANGFLSVDYSRLSVLLMAGMKEQQEMIDRQQEQIQFLLNEVAGIKADAKTKAKAKEVVSKKYSK